MKVSEELKRVNDGIKKVDSLIDERNAKISKLKEKANNLQRKIDKIEEDIRYHEDSINEYRFPQWTDVLIALKEDMERVSGMAYETSKQTFGLGCQSYMTLKDNSTGEKMTIIVLPGYTDANELIIQYVTGEKINIYPDGSIGAISGMNNITALLPDTAEEIFELMKKRSTR